MKDAGTTGTVGPNLDAVRPARALIVDRVTHGKGAMPWFAGRLSKDQIGAIATYVSATAGSP